MWLSITIFGGAPGDKKPVSLSVIYAVAVAPERFLISVSDPKSAEKLGVPGLSEDVPKFVNVNPPMTTVPRFIDVPEGAVAITSPARGGLFVPLAQISRSARAGLAIPMATIAVIAAIGENKRRKQ
jgi:hypothetical protein